MVLELHIWGPAFGLPSIEPACIATVAYCQQVLPQEQWRLIADYELTVGSGQSLPVLIDDGVTTAVGYEDIVAYLRNYPGITGDLDAGLANHQQTDRIAFTSFLQSTATPLIDLLLYVSAENYNTVTSSAYTAILPWWANYSIPPKRRNLARTRTAHMGLSSLDIDTTADDDIAPGRGTASSDYEAAKRAAGIPTESQPNTLHMGRGKGLGGFLGTPVYAARFRLDSLSNELLEPLSDLLGKKEYILGGKEPSSLDCLAFGYLALLYFPEVPQAWLRETIQAKFPNLGAYLRRLRERFFSSEQINSADVWSISIGAATGKGNGFLPWGPRSVDIATRTSLGARELIGNMPLLSLLSERSAITHVSYTRASVKSALPSQFFMNTLYGITATIAVGLASLAVHHRRSPRDGPLIFWALRPNAGLGEAGNILSVLAQQLPASGGYSQF